MKKLITVVVAVALTALALRYAPVPFTWVSAIWVVAGVLAAVFSRSSSTRAVWINATAVIAALGLAELYFWADFSRDDQPDKAVQFREEGTITEGYYVDSEFLGYALPPNREVTQRRYYGDDLLFDVVYTTDARGLRVTPILPSTTNEPCILFFGDSFTFGYGVNDDETMPYKVGEKTARRTLNFGVGGYGVHQMLSALEHGIVEDLVDCRPSHAIYQGLMDHIARAAGKRFWDEHGPRYVLAPDGSAQFAGRFSDVESDPAPLGSILQKSYVYRGLVKGGNQITDKDVDLFLAIVATSRDQLQRLYPGLSFHVIFWGTGQEKVLNGIRELEVPLHPIDRILPDYENNRSVYEISPHEKHPTPLAHDRIADYVVREILQ